MYIPTADCLFVTSNQYHPTASSTAKTITISKLTRRHNEWTREHIETPVTMPNGGVNHGQDILFCAQGDAADAPSALVSVSPSPPYAATPLLDNFHGRRFNSLNDVVVRSDGSVWFTDPTYGHAQGIRTPPELPNQVYRFEPRTGDVRVVADGFERPNGITFAPDERTAYVTDTGRIRGDGGVDHSMPSTMCV